MGKVMIPGMPVGRHEVELGFARARAAYSGLNGATEPTRIISINTLSGMDQVPDQSGSFAFGDAPLADTEPIIAPTPTITARRYLFIFLGLAETRKQRAPVGQCDFDERSAGIAAFKRRIVNGHYFSSFE
jgi:hypothetical protein